MFRFTFMFVYELSKTHVNAEFANCLRNVCEMFGLRNVCKLHGNFRKPVCLAGARKRFRKREVCLRAFANKR